jgi:hypothetical protein
MRLHTSYHPGGSFIHQPHIKDDLTADLQPQHDAARHPFSHRIPWSAVLDVHLADVNNVYEAMNGRAVRQCFYFILFLFLFNGGQEAGANFAAQDCLVPTSVVT